MDTLKVKSARLCEFEAEGRRDRGRPCTWWLNGTKKECTARSLELRDAKVMCMDREQWKDFVSTTNDCECMRQDESTFDMKECRSKLQRNG